MVRGIANSKIGFGDLILLLRYFFKLKVSTHPILIINLSILEGKMENVTQLFLEAEWEYISSNEMYDIYFDISNSLRKKEQELKEREKKDSAQIFGLLAKATSMSLVNSINEPYKAYIENFQTGQRSTIPDDFTIDDLASFESLLTVVTEPLLKARLADLLWLLHKPRNPEHARIVIDLYFLCEIDEET
ncbi:hypothetical protein D9Y31_19160 [Acinetobacter baumannii]|nr:hypothetical protein D9Y30_19505 [Acinetobacter baumannii]TKV52617.1 hypothetical protein D9Y31_19160 [Acinetobacter baumannii]